MSRLRRLSPIPTVLLAAFAVHPFAEFLSGNRLEIVEPGRIVVWAMLCVLAVVAIHGLVVVAIRQADAARLAVAFVPTIYTTLNFKTIRGVVPGNDTTALAGWAAVCVVGGIAAYSAARSRSVVAYGLVAGLLLAGYPTVSYTAYRIDTAGASPLDRVAGASAGTGDTLTRTPNIYHFVLDGYTGEPALSEVVGYDNADFYGALRRRGFRLPQTAANYPTTVMSLAATMDMRYVATRPDDLEIGRRPFHKIMQGRNRAVRLLRSSGYSYAHSEAGDWDGTKCTDAADRCLRPRRRPRHTLDELERGFLERTPLPLVLDRVNATKLVGSSFPTPDEIVGQLLGDPTEIRQPMFFFGHFITPHPPYRLDSECRETGATDREWGAESRYREQMECLNRQMISAIDRILALDPDAVIIVHGDHGSGFHVDLTETPDHWNEKGVAERFSALLALRLPDDCSVPRAMTLVNIYPTVFSCLGAETDLLPNRQFLVGYDTTTFIEEVQSPHR